MKTCSSRLTHSSTGPVAASFTSPTCFNHQHVLLSQFNPPNIIIIIRYPGQQTSGSQTHISKTTKSFFFLFASGKVNSRRWPLHHLVHFNHHSLSSFATPVSLYFHHYFHSGTNLHPSKSTPSVNHLVRIHHFQPPKYMIQVFIKFHDKIVKS